MLLVQSHTDQVIDIHFQEEWLATVELASAKGLPATPQGAQAQASPYAATSAGANGSISPAWWVATIDVKSTWAGSAMVRRVWQMLCFSTRSSRVRQQRLHDRT